MKHGKMSYSSTGTRSSICMNGGIKFNDSNRFLAADFVMAALAPSTIKVDVEEKVLW